MVINTKIFQCYLTRTGGWFRLFGIGMGYKDLRHSPLVFSERNGFKSHFEIGNWSFAPLT